jgi:addiction module RelE/StbE family toxin
MDMVFKIEYISTFHFDVLDVVSSLADYPQKAKRIFEKLDGKLLTLADNPEMYPIYEDFPDFRRIVIEDYLVFYTVNERDGIIEIHRLIYGRMDIAKQLSDSGCQ